MASLKLELVDAPSETPFVRAEIQEKGKDVDVKVFKSTKLAVEAENGRVDIREEW